MNLLPSFVGAPEVGRVYHCNALTLLRAMPDAYVDIVVTSPPYNTLHHEGEGSGMHKGNAWVKKSSGGYSDSDDNMPENVYQQTLRNVVAECLRVSKGLVWVNHKTRYREGCGIHPLSFLQFPFWSEVIWDRGGTMTLNARKFAPSHEFVYGFGFPHYWQDKSNTLLSVWRIIPRQQKNGHPCPYPEQLVERLIEASCPPDGIVLDPFMGSGTTAAVANRLGRRYIGCDISLEYVELARKRLALPYTPPMFTETPTVQPTAEQSPLFAVSE